jgi:Fibronectin type III domain
MMISGLQSQTTYFFGVRAVNSGGPSPYSNVASATTLGENQPAAPTELRATALSGSKIALTWRDNSVNETRFGIERSTGGAPFQRAGTAQANAQSFTDTGLKRSTLYVYRVRACNSSLCSPPSNTASATTSGR